MSDLAPLTAEELAAILAAHPWDERLADAFWAIQPRPAGANWRGLLMQAKQAISARLVLHGFAIENGGRRANGGARLVRCEVHLR